MNNKLLLIVHLQRETNLALILNHASMKNNLMLLICIFLFLSPAAMSQKAIFLHHSTGWGVYTEGHVAEWIANYNNDHATSYVLDQRSFPGAPYPWDNYPYDYWNLWINNVCDNSNPGIACMDNLCANYDVIIFKHCYPGAGIIDDPANPVAGSPVRSLATYKLQYRALRDLMDSYPDNKFIVWTLAPLHRLVTNATIAARARTFVDWVKNDWLTEDGKQHPNIYIFDLFGYLAESNPSPAQGAVNCLKYEYEFQHENTDDSHPNTLANETVGPLFAQFIVNTIESRPEIMISAINITSENSESTISVKQGSLRLSAGITPENASNKAVTWSVENVTGQAVISSDGVVTATADGTVTAKATATDGSNVFGTMTITISNQSLPTAYDENSDVQFSWILDDNNLVIRLNDTKKYSSLHIFDVTGRKMTSQKIDQNTVSVSTTGFPPGVYIATLLGDNERRNFKISKQ
jgi:hypothetical protein